MQNTDEQKSRKKNAALWCSFGFAFKGIARTIRDERNVKIHLAAACLVTIAGFLLGISKEEWMICLLLFALVISLELVNTAIEATVDLCTEEHKYLAGKAKDAAAGAVLVAAIVAAIIGCMIFLPKLALVLG